MAIFIRNRFAKGIRHVPGVMNKTEARYAQHLELMRRASAVLWFEFEAIKLRLAAKTFYTPDFFLMNGAGELEVHEVKGTSAGKPWVEDDASVKIKVAAEKFPFRFKMVWLVNGVWLNRLYGYPQPGEIPVEVEEK